ncbi:helix-turn-helix domain-containing protein [Paenibacillus sp. GCM10027626]|uniref:AraC family transcriptional regulator n=1 Tax=Paenibacillus sp. GCM10027626 TaxID=3273411 RepID=UPI00364217A3
MRFPRHEIQVEIEIRKLISLYYFELSKDYHYAGEQHDFWELYYVDKGEIELETDSGNYILKQGDLLFHEPNEFHIPKSNGKIAPNVFIVTFECDSPAMSFFLQHKKFRLRNEEKIILSMLMKEGFNAFTPDTVGLGKRLHVRADAPFGSQQLFRFYLEALLIHLIRHGCDTDNKHHLSSSTRENQEAQLIDKMKAYMEEHLADKLMLEHLCDQFSISRTQLSLLFKKQLGCAVMEYLNRMKIERAKLYIREDIYNLTEISALLGYSSVHYFSRQFKKTTSMTPSEYARTLNAGSYWMKLH